MKTGQWQEMTDGKSGQIIRYKQEDKITVTLDDTKVEPGDAKANSEDYEHTTFALQSIADEEGFAVEDGVLLGYIGDATEITVPKGIEEIDSCAFSSDMGRGNNLKKVTIGNDVEKINASAFSFTEADIIVIEEGVEEIGDHCFMDSYIDEIYFPESVNKIGQAIMETEEGLDGTIIHCVEDSVAAKYFEKDMPYGSARLKCESKIESEGYGIIGLLFIVIVVVVGVKIVYKRRAKK